MGVLSKPLSPPNSCSMSCPLEQPAERERRPERLRDWVINQINSGKFRGLEWLDKEKTTFRVPWIHAKKRDYDEERDSALFKEWAMHTGKYKPHENKTIGYDPTTWKINFRCALNGLKDIMEIKEYQTEWYRVYKVLPSVVKRRRPKEVSHRTRPYPAIAVLPTAASMGDYASQGCCEGWEGGPVPYPYGQSGASLMAANSQYLPTICTTSSGNQFLPTECGPRLAMAYSTSPTYISGTITSTGACQHSGDECERDGVTSPLVHKVESGGSTPLHSPHSSSPASSHLGDVLLPQMNSVGHPHYHPGSLTDVNSSCLPQSTQSCYIDQIIKEIEASENLSPSMSPSMHQEDIRVTILYGSIVVHSEVISCTHGCRISFGSTIPLDKFMHPEAEKLFGPSKAHQIPLPPNHPDPRAAGILENMKRGLVLSVNNGDIYATALCRSTVYYSNSPRDSSFSLGKEETYKVFDYHESFVPQMANWNPTKPYPNPFTIFSLGQSWGSGNGRRVQQNLINVIVTSQQAQHDLHTHGAIRCHPSDDFSCNMLHPISVYDETQYDTLADIQLDLPHSNNSKRFELQGSFNLPQF